MLLKVGKYVHVAQKLKMVNFCRLFFCALSTKESISRDFKYVCHNYHPLPTVITKGQGIYVWDTDGKKYIDFISGFTANNFGHSHPKLIATLIEQSKILHHTSRAVHTDILGEYCEYICKLFGYDKALPMNTGVEAADSACKLARKWGYKIKGIAANEAKILFAHGNFWGRSLAAISASTDPVCFENYGPFLPGTSCVPFNDLISLEKALMDPQVCGFMVEPIQGDAGIIVPDVGYLKGIRSLCRKYNVLWIADEIQTGMGRTGRRLAVDYENVSPDILVLGKALGGGVFPVSVALANDYIMLVMEPGTHGSTYGGNPLGSKVAMTALQILEEEMLAENAFKMGKILIKLISGTVSTEIASFVRGKGLMNAIVINENYAKAWDVCLQLKKNGLLAKILQKNVIRLAPPLIINEQQISESADIIVRSINYFVK